MIDLQKISTEELLSLKENILEELHNREINKTAVVWGICDNNEKYDKISFNPMA